VTASEITSNLRTARLTEPIEIFLYLANHFPELETSDGQKMNDLTDFATFLREFAEALAPSANPARPGYYATCHVCGHSHQGPEECGEFIGTGPNGPRYCRCEAKVAA
jgi:hypothetical protein